MNRIRRYGFMVDAGHIEDYGPSSTFCAPVDWVMRVFALIFWNFLAGARKRGWSHDSRKHQKHPALFAFPRPPFTIRGPESLDPFQSLSFIIHPPSIMTDKPSWQIYQE